MQPSLLLLYTAKEGANPIRTVPKATMDYFWNNRVEVAKVVWNRNVSEIILRMGVPELQNGFYVVTKYKTRPLKKYDSEGQCKADTCNSVGVCLHGAEYIVETEYSHYTIVKRLPDVLRDTELFQE